MHAPPKRKKMNRSSPSKKNMHIKARANERKIKRKKECYADNILSMYEAIRKRNETSVHIMDANIIFYLIHSSYSSLSIDIIMTCPN